MFTFDDEYVVYPEAETVAEYVPLVRPLKNVCPHESATRVVS